MAGRIEKVVILFLENHTTDNVASDVVGVDGDPSLPRAPDVVLIDPRHDHAHWMRRASGARRQRYGRDQLPHLYRLMDSFTVCDRYFTDFTGNSFPNHAFAIGADAEGCDFDPWLLRPFELRTPGVPVRLEAAGRTWANYGNGYAFKHYSDPRMRANVRHDVAGDALAGRLPDVSWVYGPRGRDFHAGIPYLGGSIISASDAWLGSVVDAISAGPDWLRVAVFVTFDDWGGWTDHVEPPVVERYAGGDPYRFGSRVPCVVAGPYAKPRYVSHVRASHVSLVAFIERLWGLPPSPNPDAARRTTAPDERALEDCFDLDQEPLPPPARDG
jgi:phospholipase C